MLEKDEFKRWIEASHALFEIFEGRYDAYPLAVRWVEEWFSSKKFTILKEHTETIDRLIQNFNYDAFRTRGDRIKESDNKWKDLVSKIDQQFKRLRERYLKTGECESVGFAVAPFLFTWNFQRFKEYFRESEGFDLERYFKKLGAFLESKESELRTFRDKKLIEDRVEDEKVKEIFQEINSELRRLGGGRKNEPIGTIKLLHILAPHYFPLIDNKIAKATGLCKGRESIKSESYIKWMNKLKEWLQNYVDIIEELQNRFQYSILKLVDEGLYLMSSVKLRYRVAKLGLK